MEEFFFRTGVVFLGYWSFMLLRDGFGDLLWLWPILSLASFSSFFSFHILRKDGFELRKSFTRPGIMFISSYMIALSIIFLIIVRMLFETWEERPGLDYVIVIGSDSGNAISEDLTEKLDMAVDYGRENPGTVFVLAGCQGRSGNTEAVTMYHYMIERGVPEKRLLMEFYSTSVKEKIGFSLRMIDQHRKMILTSLPGGALLDMPPGAQDDVIYAEERPVSIGIITTRAKVLRTKLLMKGFGRDDSGIMVAHESLISLPDSFLKEAVRIFKDRIVGNI